MKQVEIEVVETSLPAVTNGVMRFRCKMCERYKRMGKEDLSVLCTYEEREVDVGLSREGEMQKKEKQNTEYMAGYIYDTLLIVQVREIYSRAGSCGSFDQISDTLCENYRS